MRNLSCMVKLAVILFVLFFLLSVYSGGMRYFAQTYWWMSP